MKRIRRRPRLVSSAARTVFPLAMSVLVKNFLSGGLVPGLFGISVGNAKENKNTYNTEDSLVVTDPTTSSVLTGLSMGEQTGSRVFLWIVVISAKYAEFGSPRVQEMG
jgi:hypothetical protein